MNSYPLVIALAIAATALVGCAGTTGVVPIGRDTYSVSHRDNGPMASLGALKAQAYKEASAFCAAKEQDVEVLKANDVPRSLGQFPETEIVFTCAKK